MTWDERLADDRARLLAELERGARPGARAADRADRPAPRRRGRAAGVLEEVYLHLVREAHRRTGVDEPLPRRRRRAERGRERAHPPGDAVRGRLRPARGRRRGHAVGAAFHVWSQVLGRAARLRDGARLHGPGVRRRRRARRRSAPAGFDGRAPATTTTLFPLVAERIAGGRRRRLVPGPDGVRPARARQPLDRRRPAPAGHEGHPQRADQAPRAVPAVRALDPRRGRPASGSSRTTRRRS